MIKYLFRNTTRRSLFYKCYAIRLTEKRVEEDKNLFVKRLQSILKLHNESPEEPQIAYTLFRHLVTFDKWLVPVLSGVKDRVKLCEDSDVATFKSSDGKTTFGLLFTDKSKYEHAKVINTDIEMGVGVEELEDITKMNENVDEIIIDFGSQETQIHLKPDAKSVLNDWKEAIRVENALNQIRIIHQKVIYFLI